MACYGDSFTFFLLYTREGYKGYTREKTDLWLELRTS
jgi:hypothetical protein